MRRFLFYAVPFALCGLLGPHHAPYADDDEGNGEYLSHIDGQRGLEGFLDFLGILDEEAEGEDIGQAEAEVPACANLLRPLLMQCPHNDKQEGVGDGLVELSWMARQRVDTLEDEGPGKVCSLADDFAVHEVAQSDKAGGGACGNSNVVEHRPKAQLRLFAIEPEGKHEACRTTVRGQACVARHFPASVGFEMDGQQHLNEALERREEVVGLVEDAMP